MADVQTKHFDKRLRRIEKRHRKMAYGYVTSVNRDGLIKARPDSLRIPIPWKGFTFSVALLLLLKGILLAYHGPVSYGIRVEQLAGGSIAEQIGAFLMQIDPISAWISGLFI